jgi:hypothetical protein
MKLRIETIQEVMGKTINSNWKEPMYIINDMYICSSIYDHNWGHDSEGWRCDFKRDEEADVTITPDNKGLKDLRNGSEGRVWEWIARIT